MTPPTPRRFTIADTMILTGAGAVASLLLRHVGPGWAALAPRLGSVFSGLGGFFVYLLGAQSLGGCVVIPLMVAQVVVRLRAPRPLAVRDEPGLVASMAVLAALVPGAIWMMCIGHRPPFWTPNGFEQVWGITTQYTSTAVPGAWLALVLARRWRPRADWVDRFGRALGWYWVVLFVGWDAGLTVMAIDKAISTWGWR